MADDDGECRDPVVPEAAYANFFRVGHNAFEFLLDFGQLHPESSEPRLHTRIITGPAYAMALSRTLRESLDRYQHVHGSIPEPDEEDGS